MALTRLEGELVADGFDVLVVSALPPLSNDQGEDAQGVAASIAIAVNTESRTAELTVVDRLTHKWVVRQMAMEEPDGAKAAKILAVRAVELLRASLLELLTESSLPSPPPQVDASGERQASRWASRALRLDEQGTEQGGDRRGDWAVEAGAALHLNPRGGVGPAVVGVLRVRRALGRAFALRVSVAGGGTEPRVSAPEGSATVSQAVGLFELVGTPWSDLLVRPIFSLGAGALSTIVDGQGFSPYLGRQGTQVSLALDAGVGVAIRLGQRFDLALEAHALTARPYPSVRFVGVEVARADAPAFFGSVTVASFL